MKGLSVILFLLLVMPSDLFGQLYQWNGDNTYNRMGESVSSAGDVDGDGFDDVLVGALGAQHRITGSRTGSVFVYSGANGALLFQWDGRQGDDRFGISASAAGDVDGDGFMDFIVGADSADRNGRSSGSATVFSGATGDFIYHWDGEGEFDRYGWSVSGAGDVNGDGFDDLIVGALYADNLGLNGGSAYVYSGANGSLLYRWDGGASDAFGGEVSGAGDVNGDGFDDLLIGARGTDYLATNGGSAYVYSGVNGTLLYRWDGQNSQDSFGGSVSAAGDVNSDGYADLIIGEWEGDFNGIQGGAAYVYSGVDGSLLYRWNGRNSYDRFGGAVAGAGDVNGDGFDDLIVGALWADNNGTDSGTVYVYSGANGNLLNQWDGQNPGDDFGKSVSGAGDVNGDGFGNVIVGANFASNNGIDSGSAYVYQVSAIYSITPLTAGSTATFTMKGAAPNSNVILGYSLLGAGPFTTQFGIVDLSAPISILAVLAADANGDASWTANIPGSLSGRTLYTQGLNVGLLSNSLAELIN